MVDARPSKPSASVGAGRVREVLLDHRRLVRVELVNRRGQPRKVVIRVVRTRSRLRYQINTTLQTGSLTRNITPAQFRADVDALLARRWPHLVIATTTSTIQGHVSKTGEIVARETSSVRSIERSHDQPKPRLLSPDAEFLRVLGVATADGIRADKRRKYLQIDKFLRLLDEAGRLRDLPRPLALVDLGCGSADLTFATYHYLNDVAGIPATLTGVDVNAEAVEMNNRRARTLGWEGLHFVAAPIDRYAPDASPDVVVALHACDTATDDALAQAVRWRARVILAAPCCHRHLQLQLAQGPPPDEWALLHRHKVMVQRLGDLLTETLRASMLTLHGYTSDVFQFVAHEHTGKNVMIRAVRTRVKPSDTEIDRYRTLCRTWRVTPRLEELLGLPSPAEGRRSVR